MREYIRVFGRDRRQRGWLYFVNLWAIKVVNMFVLFGFKVLVLVLPAFFVANSNSW